MKKVLKIFGERNTGTNYFSELILKNFDVELLDGKLRKGNLFTFNEWTKDLYFSFTKKHNLGWKHSSINIDLINNHNNQPVIITLTKNPYSFLLSLFKRPYHYKGRKPDTFSAFLASKWGVRKRDNYNKEYYTNPIVLWNKKNQSYINLNTANIVSLLFTYEELLADPNRVLKKISFACDLPLRENFSNIDSSTKNDDKNFSDYQKYYLNEEWKESISNEELLIINSYLDEEVMSFFNYSKIDT